ncbi:FGGY family carbohydrate kinase [Gordonia polyisoprenivorans]|uniref:FGGY family carbohydrate kinase n=1 Tax=Gordonia polyisoprenivorans TaxID=84595 RepID=UPI0003605933|nr:FGGY family carbohydrate kinase [Gordonia polyisoprenivorans]
MPVLAIDQGTSGTKAAVVADDGTVLAISERQVQPRYLADGGVEHDPQQLLESVVGTGREAVAHAATTIDAVSLANQGETVLAWDRQTGEPLSPAIVWQDRRSESVCAGLDDHRAEIRHRTGLELDSYFSAPKMTWLRENVTRDGVITTSDTWLVHALTGEFVTDRTTASRSLVTDLNTTEWDANLLALFGLDSEALPTIVDNDAIVGTTKAFGPSAPVGGLVVDQQAALLAQGCLKPGSAKCTFGTGAFVLANAGESPTRSHHGLATSVAWRLREQTAYCLDGQAYTAASAIKWLQNLGLIDHPSDLDRLAVEETEGVIFVPALAGLAAPWWRPDARASFIGMGLASERGHLVGAVLEGIAAQTVEVIDAMHGDISQSLDVLRVDGGLTRSRRLMQAVSDIGQVTVEVFPSSHATALGAAVCARMAAHPSITLPDGVPSWSPAAVYRPRWSPDRAADFRRSWLAAATSTFPQKDPR